MHRFISIFMKICNIMARKIKMGMIGGSLEAFIGAVHRRGAALDGEVELVCGAFSSNPEKSKATGEALYLPKNRVYGSFEEMILKEKELPEDERMDFVTIVTPNHVHFSAAKMALENGFHVVSDKPATLNTEEVYQLRDIIEKSGLIYCLTVTDLAGTGSGAHRLDSSVDLVIADPDLYLDLGLELHQVLGATIQFGMALLTAITFHFLDGHTVDTDLLQRFANVIKLERLDDCSHHFHVGSSPLRCPIGMFYRICGGYRVISTVTGRSGTRILPHCGAKVNRRARLKGRNCVPNGGWLEPAACPGSATQSRILSCINPNDMVSIRDFCRCILELCYDSADHTPPAGQPSVLCHTGDSPGQRAAIRPRACCAIPPGDPHYWRWHG